MNVDEEVRKQMNRPEMRRQLAAQVALRMAAPEVQRRIDENVQLWLTAERNFPSTGPQ